MPIDLTPLANVGAVGLVLAFHLLQILPRLERIERAINVQSRALLLDIVARENTTSVVRRQAKSMLMQIDKTYQDDEEV